MHTSTPFQHYQSFHLAIFIYRFILPCILVFASLICFTLPNLPYILAFLAHQRRPALDLPVHSFPIFQLIILASYALLGVITHVIIAILITTKVFTVQFISSDLVSSLAIPDYQNSLWQGIRFLLPHALVLITTLITLFIPVPSIYNYHGRPYVIAWFLRRARKRRAASLISRASSSQPLLQLTADTSSTDSNSLHDHNSNSSEDHADSESLRNELHFLKFAAGYGGIFWCCVATALTAVSYSSLMTFIFLIAFSIVIISWGLNDSSMRPLRYPSRCLKIVSIFRIYVSIYLIVLLTFQLPWVVRFSDPSRSISGVLKFVGFVPINSSQYGGWTAIIAVAGALATYVFTGIFATALSKLTGTSFMNEQVTSHGGDENRNNHHRRGHLHISARLNVLDIEAQRDFYDNFRMPSYFELQVLVFVMYLSSIGPLVWCLFFPGILTLPLLIASFSYMSFRKARTGTLVDYSLLYAFLLQMGHYLLAAAMNAFGTSSDDDPAIVLLLGLRTLGLQFTMNLIQTIAMILLCIHVSSKRYLQLTKAKLKRQTKPSESVDIRDLVLFSFRERHSQMSKNVYSPLKLCIDQVALASLYVSGGLSISALNAVFLLGLAIVCLLQSLGLFRRPRVFQIFWSVVFVYSMAFLFITSTFCRSVDGFWECDRGKEGVQSGDSGQVVAYAITTLLASLQMNFTWSQKTTEEAGLGQEFNSHFWTVLRKYFISISYIILLLYPLVFPANFLSYGYVLFLFFSIIVEFVLPSIRGSAQVRLIVKKYWLLVIAFSAAAMLSRYFVRLQWFEGNTRVQRWVFGLGNDNTTKFRVTIGDALVLIVMSLQGRLFVVDSIMEEQSQNQNPSGRGSIEDVTTSETFSSSFQDDATPSHNTLRSIENEPERPRQNNNSSVKLQPTSSSDPTEIMENPTLNRSRTLSRMNARRDSLTGAENRRRQAIELWHTVRSSAAVRRTKMFLRGASQRTIVVLRKLILCYSYVIEALGILVASVWLINGSVFGAIYLILGCMVLLTEQPISDLYDTESDGSIQERRLANSLPTVLIILSFTLLSAQYMHLMVVFLVNVEDFDIPNYLGLQRPETKEELPIMVDAVVAHVVVFLAAILHKVGRQWGKRNVEDFATQRNETYRALGNAVVIGHFVPGVGGDENAENMERPDVRHSLERYLQPVPRNFDVADVINSPITSSSDSSDSTLPPFIVRVRDGVANSFKYLAKHVEEIAVLFAPFWRSWGFDATLSCIVVSAVATNTIFSVIYAGLVLAVGGLPKPKTRTRWHQFCLLLSILILVQYGLTLGKPFSEESNSLVETLSDSWGEWLFLAIVDSRRRKMALTFGFLNVVLAGITLNTISPHPRKRGFWFSVMPEKSEPMKNTGISLAHVIQEIQGSQENQDNSASSAASSKSEENVAVSRSRPPLPQAPRAKKEQEEGRFEPFVSGLGQHFAPYLPENLEELGESTRGGNATRQAPGILRNVSKSPPLISENPILRRPSSFSLGNQSSFDDRISKPADPHDFTKRPISFGNAVKLHWMRFSGPLVQLFIFAVASVDTNVASAFLLLVAFSFLFKFPNMKAKTSRFLFLRYYILIIIFIFVLTQAPFTGSDRPSWLDILGFYDKKSAKGQTVLGLLVSLWIFCQIQGRIYGSNDYIYVQKYSLEDANLRFKRAVHEHNSRKFEKMLSKNRSDRSRIAREARLNRLERELMHQETGVRALYKVCVEDEIKLLREKAAHIKNKLKKFSSHYFNVDPLDEELKKMSGLSKFIRRLMRGSTWKRHISQSLFSEAQSFVMRYSSVPVYVTMLLAVIANPSVLTVVYPVIIFLYLILEQPRPPKLAWTVIMIYTCICIAFKYVLRSQAIPFCSTDVPFFGFGNHTQGENPSVKNFRDCATAAGIGFEIFILLALLGHRAVLYTRGVWDLKGSEEQMLLSQTIRGRKCATSEDMKFISNPTSAKESGSDHSSFQNDDDELVYSAVQQCDDAAQVLNDARRQTVRFLEKRNTINTQKVSKPSDENSLTVSQQWEAFEKQQVTQIHQRQEKKSTGRDGHTSFPFVSHTKHGYWPLFAPAKETKSGKYDQRPSTAPPPNAKRMGKAFSPPLTADTNQFQRSISRMFTTRTSSPTPEEINKLDNMTSGQTQMQEILTPISDFPEQSQNGPISKLRRYFSRLTKENDHKAIGDYYLAIFMVDFISFIYVMFGFTYIFRDTGSSRVASWWANNFIQTRHLITLLIMFLSIIFDRVCYLKRSMTGKLVLQYVSVISYHAVLFLFQENIGGQISTRIFYALRCIYFFLSGLQIRDGYPMYTTAQFLLRNYSTFGIVLFEIYIFVPYLWLCRTLLDWAVVPTSLEIFQYFRYIDIYLWLYRNRAVNRSRGSFQRTLGKPRRWLPRIYQGFGLFTLCVLTLFLPFIIFSILNPFFKSRQLSSATLDVSLRTNTSSAGRIYPIFSRSSVIREEPLNNTEQVKAAESIGIKGGLDVGEREQVYDAWFSPLSEAVWDISLEDREDLTSTLLSSDNDSENNITNLAFTLTVSTTDREVFGTPSEEAPLNQDQVRRIARAISNRENFAEAIKYPLPRYSILQASTTVFGSLDEKESSRLVCVRLVHYLQEESDAKISFWSVSDCSNQGDCDCSVVTRIDPDSSTELRHILQIADISVLQVGGATILSFYFAILFTFANLLKRMFIDKRLIIPYIDMPYTLHLYQLVLDIMYARQDGRYDLEEVLYNRLIDIYRDQHELVKWTGERALKVPEEWWSKDSYSDDPFRVYPSFDEKPNEPYLDRKVE